MRFFNNILFPFNTLACAVAIIIIAFTIIALGWKPCPMCLLQQLSVLVIFTISLFAWLKNHSKNLEIIIRAIIIIAIIFGLYVAASQSYIQHFHSTLTVDKSSCGAVTNPFLVEATKTITGSVESCVNVNEQISGISLAIYSFIFFMCLLIINIVSFFINLFKRSKV